MSKILFYDFETSGLPLFDQPSDDPRQPHIVQAAAMLVDSETRQEISSINLIACPDGWHIPDEVARVHGITEEYARTAGVDENVVVNALHALWMTSTVRVAHNETFDARIMRIALKRWRDEGTADHWKAGVAECTARMSSPIIKMAPTPAMLAAGRRHPKTPKLTEAYQYFLGVEMGGAHSALGDVRGCMAVYWAIKDRESQTQPPRLEDPPSITPATGGDADVSFLTP